MPVPSPGRELRGEEERLSRQVRRPDAEKADSGAQASLRGDVPFPSGKKKKKRQGAGEKNGASKELSSAARLPRRASISQPGYPSCVAQPE